MSTNVQPTRALARLVSVAMLATCLPATAVVITTAVPASASSPSSCSEGTGGSTETLIKADNTSTTQNGYNCAYVYTTGNNSIDLAGIEVVSHTTGKGYQEAYDCTYGTGVVVTKSFTDGGGSTRL